MKRLVAFAFSLVLVSCGVADETTETPRNNTGESDGGTCTHCNCQNDGETCGSTSEGTCRNRTCYHWCIMTTDAGYDGPSPPIDSCENPCALLGLKTWTWDNEESGQ